ncbi:MAG: ATP-binding protein [Trueperaceae bacterium]
MMPTLRLLGVARVAVDDRWTDLPNTVGALIVSVVALREGWVSRTELSELVWPDHDEATARKHLRWHLHKIRRSPGFDGIELERDRVRWSVRSDVHEFVRAFREERWLAAVTHYHGPLLTGLAWPESSELAEWLATERGLLQGLWREASLKATDVLEAAGRPAEGARIASKLLELDPLDEEALRRFVRLAAAGALTGEALAAYTAFEGTLLSELRLQPLEETRSLMESVRLRAVSLPGTPAVLQVGGSVPHTATRLVGRERETREVQDLLARPDCRLVSLTGFGGIGKSRLALEVAARAGASFTDGVVFVPLQAVGASELVPSAVASALHLVAPDRAGVAQQVLQHLGERQALIVLDAFEHVLDARPFVESLLERARGVKLVVTSRERIGAHGEWVVPVDGLASPGADDEISPDVARSFGAVELFTNAARRESHVFSASTADVAAIGRIARALGGLPLGLELAASWTRMLTCEQIADEIERDPDFLRADAGVARNHQSLRMVFDRSWRSLDAASQRVLLALSLFRAGFTREAAAFVAGAGLEDLLRLTDASLVQRAGDRFTLHEVVRRFALDQLVDVPTEHVAVAARFRGYYARFIAETETVFRGPAPMAALRTIERDLGNVLATWEEAAAVQDVVTAGAMLDGLFLYFERGGLFQEIRDILERAERAFAGGGQRYDVFLARLRATRGWCCHRMGENDIAAELLGASLDAFRARGEAVLASSAATSLAIVLHGAGEVERAERLCADSLASCRERGDLTGIGRNLHAMGLFATRVGEHERAEAPLREALETYDRSQDAVGRGVCLNSLGHCSFSRGRYDDAHTSYAAALGIARATGDRRSEGMSAMNVGNARRHSGDLAAARGWYLIALEIFGDIGEARGRAAILNNLGNLARDMNDDAAAERYYLESLALKRASGDRLALVTTLRNVAQALLVKGDAQGAHQHVDEALEIASSSGAWAMAAESYRQRGAIELRQGSVEDAQTAFRRALELAVACGSDPVMLRALVSMSESYVRVGRDAEAARLLAAVLADEAADNETRAEADAIVGMLGDRATLPAAPSCTLRELVDEVVSGLARDGAVPDAGG